MGLLVLFFILSIFFSFLCSILEAVLLSITPSYVNIQKQKGGELGRTLQRFKTDIDRPLSAILTLNTIAHTVGAIGVGAQAAKVVENYHAINILGFELSWEAIIASLMTLAILVLSEIIPKTIGANNWRALAPFTVRTLKILLWILAPFVFISQLITKSLKKEKNKSILSRADFTVMADVAEESGALEIAESKIIKNLLRFDQIQVNDIMTPRTVMVTANEDAHFNNFYKSNKTLRFSRVPIFNTNPDDITGYALKDDILQAIVEGQGEQPLKAARRDILIVKTVTQLPELFELLTEKREHIAIVVDNYGSVVGLVTMEDVVETLLGLEIMDELDNVADLQKLARGKWEERAKLRGLINE